MSEIPGRHLLAPNSEKAPGQGRPVSQKFKQHRPRYHIPTDVQAFLIALSPLWFAILLAFYMAGSR
jgi:hypothetical protein